MPRYRAEFTAAQKKLRDDRLAFTKFTPATGSLEACITELGVLLKKDAGIIPRSIWKFFLHFFELGMFFLRNLSFLSVELSDAKAQLEFLLADEADEHNRTDLMDSLSQDVSRIESELSQMPQQVWFHAFYFPETRKKNLILHTFFLVFPFFFWQFFIFAEWSP